MTETSERSKRHFDETVNNDQTVWALVAFCALIVHDGQQRRPDAEFGFGRRMSRITDGVEVTPDLIAQKSPAFGVAAEAKKSLSRDDTHWMKCVEQATKYRDELEGRFTQDGRIPRHDAVVLIHQSRAGRLARYIDEQVSEGKLPEPGVALVEFNQSEETTSYYFFRLERGAISDRELNDYLKFGTQVPLGAVVQSFPSLRYYDSPPPMPLLLTHLWTDYFPSLLAEAEHDERTKARCIRVSVQKVTAELQRANGSGALYRDSRSVEFPKVSWVQAAFERLKRFGLAKTVDGAERQYDVYHRGFRSDVRQHFCDLEAGLEEPPGPAEFQANLFDAATNAVPDKSPDNRRSRRVRS